MMLSDHEVATYRVEINGKLWNSFTDGEEAAKTISQLRACGMDAVMVITERKAARAKSQR